MSAAFWAIALRPTSCGRRPVQAEVPVLNKHICRDHDATVTRGHHSTVVAGSERDRGRLAAAPHQPVDRREFTELLQRLGLTRRVVSHATSSARPDNAHAPKRIPTCGKLGPCPRERTAPVYDRRWAASDRRLRRAAACRDDCRDCARRRGDRRHPGYCGNPQSVAAGRRRSRRPGPASRQHRLPSTGRRRCRRESATTSGRRSPNRRPRARRPGAPGPTASRCYCAAGSTVRPTSWWVPRSRSSTGCNGSRSQTNSNPPVLRVGRLGTPSTAPCT